MHRCLAKLIVALLVLGTSAALDDGHQRAPEPPIPSQSQKHMNYLERYGYFDHFGPVAKDSVRPAEQVREAIESMQRFAGLPVTGEIDEETAEMMAKPRCGVKDIPDTRYTAANPTEFLWSKKDLKFSIVNYPSSTNSPDLDMTQAKLDMSDAFTPWSDVSALKFAFTSTASEADIVLSFGSGVHTSVAGDPAFDGPGGVLAHAFYPNSGWGDMDGDIHFDDDETFTSGVNRDTSLFTVTVHEIGHTLGLAHTTVQGAIMYPFYAYQDADCFKLHPDDRLGIQTLYGLE